MLHLLNPFADLNETTNYRHARTLRTSLAQKIGDAFAVLSGTLFGNKPHVGLFDYLSLFIPTALTWAQRRLFIEAKWGKEDQSNGLMLALAVVSVFNLSHQIPRYALSAITTLISLPVILAVQGFVRLVDRFFSDNKMADALLLEVHYIPANDEEEAHSNQWTLQTFMNEKRIQLEDLEIKIEEIDPATCASNLQKHIDKNPGDKTQTAAFLETVQHNMLFTTNTYYSGPTKPTATQTLTADQIASKGYRALLERNIGGIARAIEEQKLDDLRPPALQ